MGELVRDTAGATHSLACGTTDRDCNEVKYLQEGVGHAGEFSSPRPAEEEDQKPHLERTRCGGDTNTGLN